MKKFFVLFSLLFSPLKSYADCFTGFACSVEELQIKQNQQEKQIIDFINSYFEWRVNEIDYITKKTKIKEYRDIFVYYKI